jgi:hypothetical protein
MTLISGNLIRLRRWPHRSALAALVVWISVGTVAAVAAQSGLETPSPARGRMQVVSQGMTNRPDLRAAWRVVKRTVPVRAEARPSNRLEGAAGFLLADGGPIFVTDQDTKQRYRLAPGEAEFVPIGANQTWASLLDGPATAFTLELAVRDSIDEAGTDEVIYNSGSFGMMEGDYDLDLLRTVQPHDERTRIDGTEFPILIFVTQGQVDVQNGDETVRLYANHGGAFEGDIRIRTASKNDAVFLAAVVGASVGGGRTSEQPTATPEPIELPTEEPTEVPTEESTVEPTPTEQPAEEGTEDSEATPERAPASQDGTDASGGVTDVGSQQAAPTEEPTQEVTAEPTPRPTFESRTGSAEVVIAVRLCPAGMNPESFDPEECARAKGEFSLALVTPFGEELRLRHADTLRDDYVRWSNLKSGVYVLEVRVIPDGYDTYSLDGFLCCTQDDGYRIRLGRGQEVVGTLYFFYPE